jgi:hypothetical protein
MKLSKNHIFNLLDRIEDKTGRMSHELPELAEKLESWQFGNLKDLYFYNFLTKFFDDINV